MSQLATLYARDALKLTREDITELVEHLRANRHKFNSGDKMAGKTGGQSARVTKAKQQAAELGIGKIEI